MTRIRIANRSIGEGEPCFIIAEAGINHNGNIVLAKRLIDAAKEAGADAVKFQTHLAQHEMLSQGPTAGYVGESLFDLLKRVELSKEDHIELKRRAIEKQVMFLSTPFSREAVDLLEQVGVEAYKVGSGEMTNFPLLKYIASKGKPVILSTGMSSIDEIRETVNFLKGLTGDLVILHCISSYPPKYEDLNIKFINVLQREFRIPVGFSDHSTGIYPSLAAVALGACVIERHFTTDRNLPGPDQKASLTPAEFAEMVKGIRIVEKVLGNTRVVTPEEQEIQKMARESVVSQVDIPQGTILKRDMVWVKRPGTGIPAKDLDKVIGRKSKVHIKANSLISWEDFSD